MFRDRSPSRDHPPRPRPKRFSGLARVRPSLPRLLHAAVAWIGYLLSPLSWWNDPVVNLPLAFAIGAGVEYVWPGHFQAAVLAGYWATNILGLVLLHRGTIGVVCKTPPCRYTRRMLAMDLAVSLAYTLVIAALVKFGLLVAPSELFRASR